MTTPTLTLDHVTLRYGDTVALNDLSLTLSDPGIHGLLGRNGSGKTSLMSLASGLRRPTSGRVLFNGEDVFENYAATSEICIIRETGDTPSEFGEKISDSLAFARDYRPHWDHAYALALLERFELSESRHVGALSRGQRARLACLLGLASRAPLTMFDESYLGMDAPARYDFYDALLEDYIEHPRMILVSSHHIEEIAKLFSSIIIIDDGKLLMYESADDLRGRGLSLTGDAATIDRITAGADVLSTRQLGSTKSVTIYGASLDLEQEARAAGLETGLLPIQDIFVHLTKRGQK